MAQEKRALVVLVFNPSNGTVSINGGDWRRVRLIAQIPDPQKVLEVDKNRRAKDFPPPGKGDDDLECLLCDEHGTCHVHLFDGTTWLDLGDDCRGSFCSM